jgi:hypothetical protein
MKTVGRYPFGDPDFLENPWVEDPPSRWGMQLFGAGGGCGWRARLAVGSIF